MVYTHLLCSHSKHFQLRDEEAANTVTVVAVAAPNRSNEIVVNLPSPRKTSPFMGFDGRYGNPPPPYPGLETPPPPYQDSNAPPRYSTCSLNVPEEGAAAAALPSTAAQFAAPPDYYVDLSSTVCDAERVRASSSDSSANTVETENISASNTEMVVDPSNDNEMTINMESNNSPVTPESPVTSIPPVTSCNGAIPKTTTLPGTAERNENENDSTDQVISETPSKETDENDPLVPNEK